LSPDPFLKKKSGDVPRKARATTRAFGIEVLEPCQGFRLFKDCLDKGI
jgi:hypothetical protein